VRERGEKKGKEVKMERGKEQKQGI